MAVQHDMRVSDEGTIFLFTPVTPEAKTWVDENVALEDYQWFGRGFSVEHRYAADLVVGMQEAGLVVV